jgi:serine/threonine-protein kinase SMG1
MSKQISLIREVESLGTAMSSHSLNTLSHRYAIYKCKRNDVNMIRNILMEKAIESERMIEDYLSFIDDKNVIGNWLMEMKTPHVPQTTISEFDMLKDFLEGSNQGQTYIQCEQLRKELDSSAHQRHKIVESALDTLLQYYNVTRYYPQEHVQHHRLSKYSKWCRSLADNKSQEFSRQVMLAYHSTYGDTLLKEKPENVIAFNFHLQTYLAELNFQLQGNYQRYQQFIDIDRNYGTLKEEFKEFLNSSCDPTLSAYELIKMNKRLLAIEVSTYNTNNLAELNINDRWYMSEIMVQTSFVSNVSELLFDTVSAKKSALFNNSLECFKTIAETLEAFERIKYEFQLNIIPQTLNGIISQNKSVLDMISELSNITKSPIADLLTKLEEDFVSCIQNPNQKGFLRAAELSEAYDGMYTQYQSQTDENLGKKIFMACHSNFEEMCRLSKRIMSFDKALNVIPDEWSCIDEIEQAKTLFISPIKSTIFMTLDQLFMVKRTQAMIEFFGYCLQNAWAFKGSGAVVNWDIEFLSHPLKLFISELLVKCILGRGSYCLSLIICHTLQHNNPATDSNKCFSLDQMCLSRTNAAAVNLPICKNYFMALEENFRHQETGAHYQKLVHGQTEYIKHVTYIISCHHWLHEDYFIAHQNIVPPIPRASLLIQFQNFIQTLSSWQTSINKIDKELKQCTVAVLQRLKWAAGANPLIIELMSNFESISNTKSVNLERERKYADAALKYSIAILNYEMLRFKTQKAIVSDEEFLNFLQQWENVCIAERSVLHTVNAIEEGIVELLDPEGPIERTWIENVTTLIDDMMNQVHSEIDTNDKRVVTTQDNLHLSAHKLRNLMSAHHRISADIRNLLKSTMKHDESVNNNESLREYFSRYKLFIESVTDLHGNVLSKDFTDNMMRQIGEQVEKSLAISNDIYNGLLGFEKTLSTTAYDDNHKKIVRSQLENCSIEYPGSPMKKGSQ